MLDLVPFGILSLVLGVAVALPNDRGLHPHKGYGAAYGDVHTITVTQTVVSTATVCGSLCIPSSCAPSAVAVRFTTSAQLPLSHTGVDSAMIPNSPSSLATATATATNGSHLTNSETASRGTTTAFETSGFPASSTGSSDISPNTTSSPTSSLVVNTTSPISAVVISTSLDLGFSTVLVSAVPSADALSFTSSEEVSATSLKTTSTRVFTTYASASPSSTPGILPSEDSATSAGPALITSAVDVTFSFPETSSSGQIESGSTTISPPISTSDSAVLSPSSTDQVTSTDAMGTTSVLLSTGYGSGTETRGSGSWVPSTTYQPSLTYWTTSSAGSSASVTSPTTSAWSVPSGWSVSPGSLQATKSASLAIHVSRTNETSSTGSATASTSPSSSFTETIAAGPLFTTSGDSTTVTSGGPDVITSLTLTATRSTYTTVVVPDSTVSSTTTTIPFVANSTTASPPVCETSATEALSTTATATTSDWPGTYGGYSYPLTSNSATSAVDAITGVATNGNLPTTLMTGVGASLTQSSMTTAVTNWGYGGDRYGARRVRN